ncbi:MAG: hypothetical protein JWQ35_1074 [Bacteriovoracaceae bacterium]|nr:hypothetical protein [Bacteriovoracaceae bacterium]
MKFFIFAFVSSVVSLFAAEPHGAPKIPNQMTELSAKLKGTWEGDEAKKPSDQTLKITYESTSGGSALVERLSPGTDHEMISMYHAENGKLAITHYCMLGNQPHLVLKKVTNDQYTFEFVPTAGIDSKKDMYMGKLVLTFTGANKLKQEWTLFEAGKAKDTTVFTLNKKS